MSLSRAGRTAPPVRLVHLGLGNFFRAHQAWYTDRAGDGWGIAAFTGRSAALADALTAQDGLYTLVTRAGDGDRFDVDLQPRARLSRRAPRRLAGDRGLPDVRAVTITVTEAGYLRGADAEPQADVDALRADPAAPVRTAPARIVAGLAARRRADAGPITLVPVRQPARQRRRGRARRGRLGRPGRPGPARVAGRRPSPRSRPWSTGSRRARPRRTRPVAGTTAARWSPSRSASGCSAATSPAGARAGRTPAPRSPTTSRRSRSASCGCSTAAIRCWPTPARPAATRRSPTPSPTTTCRGWLEEWWDGSVAASHAAGGGPRALPRRAARALLEPADPSPAGADRRRRLAEAADPGPARAARRAAAGRMPDGAVRVLAAWIGAPARRRCTGHRPARGRVGRARRRSGRRPPHPRGPRSRPGRGRRAGGERA